MYRKINRKRIKDRNRRKNRIRQIEKGREEIRKEIRCTKINING
jgi:hypothetical protein